MNDSIFSFAMPKNEPVLGYEPGSPERSSLSQELERMAAAPVEIPVIIGGKEVRTGRLAEIRRPSRHAQVLATYHKAGPEEVAAAAHAAAEAWHTWSTLPWTERASVVLRIAELLATKYRDRINAATMLGQSKTAHQAEIDAACETIDFLRFNTHFAGRIYGDQPISSPGLLNRLEYRALEGFVFAVTPFNFTAIASNLTMSPVLMGNTTLWKPASTAVLSNYWLMKIYEEAGLPAGVVNFLPGAGRDVGGTALAQPSFAGLHFTGSNGTFDHLWKSVAENLGQYRNYPRLVGETGGKDFVVVHPSADEDQVAAALVRGAFEYQGQKCSAASRAYIPKSLWPAIRERVLGMLDRVKMGEESDFGNFVSAVIDEKSFDNIMGYLNAAHAADDVEIVAGGKGDKSQGWFVEPTILRVDDPKFLTMREEIFGPVLSVFVYEDADFEETLTLCNETSPYALTGAVFARDRLALANAMDKLRHAAGNFYLNDKPTGAVVGQQPFGGARRSGTNDKAGGPLNLLRWTSARTIKETFVAPTDFAYPFLG